MAVADRVLVVLGSLLVLGYIGINFVAPLPGFLVAENIAWALLYAVATVLVLRGDGRAYPLLTAISGFNAGRVSRSIVTPYGSLAPLALEHVPLLVVITAVLGLSLVLTVRECRGPGGLEPVSR